MSRTMIEILRGTLAGDNSCAACGDVIPITPDTLVLVREMYAAGDLERMGADVIRTIFALGALDAGCGATGRGADGRPRVTCPDCATPAELAAAAAMTISLTLHAHGVTPDGDPSDN